MPRGKYVNHKGRGRSFTSPEELAREQKDLEEKKRRKKLQGDEDSEEEEEEPAAAAAAVVEEKDSSSEESSEEDDDDRKSKGVEGLLQGQIENPNRRVMKQKKLSRLDGPETTPTSTSTSAGGAGGGGGASSSEVKPELSRREREAIEKQRAKERYQKLHAEGKTEEARKDLARLAIIRKQREEAAQKRAQEAKDKEDAKLSKQSEIGKALGKK